MLHYPVPTIPEGSSQAGRTNTASRGSRPGHWVESPGRRACPAPGARPGSMPSGQQQLCRCCSSAPQQQPWLRGRRSVACSPGPGPPWWGHSTGTGSSGSVANGVRCRRTARQVDTHQIWRGSLTWVVGLDSPATRGRVCSSTEHTGSRAFKPSEA